MRCTYAPIIDGAAGPKSTGQMTTHFHISCFTMSRAQNDVKMFFQTAGRPQTGRPETVPGPGACTSELLRLRLDDWATLQLLIATASDFALRCLRAPSCLVVFPASWRPTTRRGAFSRQAHFLAEQRVSTLEGGVGVVGVDSGLGVWLRVSSLHLLFLSLRPFHMVNLLLTFPYLSLGT